jgi:hypothetical protein
MSPRVPSRAKSHCRSKAAAGRGAVGRSPFREGALVAREIVWKRGSRRRVAQIRWKRWELIHALILSLLLSAFGLWVGIWIATHHFD